MQMIAEEKAIKNQLYNIIMEDFALISYYQKNRPFVGARTADEQEKDQKGKLQAVNDLFKRFSAIKKAHTKANRETMVIVPEEPSLFNIINGKMPGKEEITIAEAINRKNAYKSKSTSDTDILYLANLLMNIYTKQFNAKTIFDDKARTEVQDQLSRRFPADSKNNWSQEKYAEIKKQLESEVEIVRIDPYKLIENNAIQKFYEQIQRYIMEIDTILSQVNASTIVEINY